MRFHPYEVSETHIVYACLGGFIVLFSMFSSLAKERLYIGEVVFATIFGIALGPSGANIFVPRDWGDPSDETTNEITLEVTRLVLALGVFAIGVELPKAYMAVHWRSLLTMVVPVMFVGYIISAGVLVGLFPLLSYRAALVISACLTPTDPILAAAVVNGHFADKNIPLRVRRIIAAESAANDGLAYPFLFLPLYLILDAGSVGEAMKDFFTVALLYQVVLGTIIGAILGFSFGKLMRLMERLGYIGPESFVVQFVALAVFVEGAVTLIGADDLLASFAAGSAVSWDGHFNERTEENAVFASLVESILNCVVFVFIGAWIRFPDMNNIAVGLTVGKIAAFFFSILFLRRLPAMFLVYRGVPELRDWKEAAFCGWFGPMGVGAVFISTLALTNLPQPVSNPTSEQEVLVALIQPIVAFTILGSIIIHGLSIPAFSFLRKAHKATLSRTLTGSGGPEWLNQIGNRQDAPSPPAAAAVAHHHHFDNSRPGSGTNTPKDRSLRAVRVHGGHSQGDGLLPTTQSSPSTTSLSIPQDRTPVNMAERRAVAFVTSSRQSLEETATPSEGGGSGEHHESSTATRAHDAPLSSPISVRVGE